MKVRLGTRGSDLALYQTRRVARWLEERLSFQTELLVITTHGDKDRERPIEQLGAVGVFTKELERALLDGEIDLAVHSLKDLPTLLPEGLVLASVPERVDPADLLLVRPEAAASVHPASAGGGFSFPLLPGARVGTSSRRRRVQLLGLRPDLEILEIRGNVPTRVQKLRRGEYDAIVLAFAGLDRLQLDLGGLVAVKLPLDVLLPAPGQAALGIEARASDRELLEALASGLHDAAAAAEVAAERRLLRLIEGGCSVPLGTHATRCSTGDLLLAAVLGPADAGPGRLRRALVRAPDPERAAELAFRILRPDAVSSAAPAPPTSGEEVGLSGRSILILRAPEDVEDLVTALEAQGARVRCEAALELLPLPSPAALRAEVEALPEELSCTLFASPGAARIFSTLLRESGLSPAAAFERRRCGAIGPGTAEALAREGVPVDFVSAEPRGSGFAREFLAQGVPNETVVLLPAARDGRPELRNALATAGFEVRHLALYETRTLPVAAAAGPWDAIVFASPSGVAALPASKVTARLVAIGETTASALHAAALPVAAVAARPTPAGLLEALAAALR